MCSSEELRIKYIAFQLKTWHFLSLPQNVNSLSYDLTLPEKKNEVCVEFNDDYKISSVFNINTNDLIEYNINHTDRACELAEDCRYIKIANNVYDLCNPQNLISIPVPPIDFSSAKYEDIPEWLENADLDVDDYTEEANNIFNNKEKRHYDHIGNELTKLLYSRFKNCYEPALLIPLCYITTQMLISSRQLFGAEKMVNRLLAFEENEYGHYLRDNLSKMCNSQMYSEWNDDDALNIDNFTRKWVTCSREYNWLRANFPKDVPQSLGQYMSWKRYAKLKMLAESKDYHLQDIL